MATYYTQDSTRTRGIMHQVFGWMGAGLALTGLTAWTIYSYPPISHYIFTGYFWLDINILWLMGGQIKFKMLHSFHYTFIILPLFLEFLYVKRCLSILQSWKHFFILWCDMFFLLLPENVIKAGVDFGSKSFAIGRKVSSLFIHGAGYFFQEYFILSSNFYVPYLLHLIPFAIVYYYCIGVLHQFRIYRLYLFHIEAVRNMAYLELFLLNELV